MNKIRLIKRTSEKHKIGNLLSDNDGDEDSTKKDTVQGEGSPEDFIDLDEEVEA
jgi:hypothetical protein